MNEHTPFPIPGSWRYGVQLARVVDHHDPVGLARVKVQLLAPDPDHGATLWARVAVPFAGASRGAFLLPHLGDEVVVMFVAGDSRAPIILGGTWNGAQSPPETLGNEGRDGVDRWSLTGRAGTRIAIVEASPGSPTIRLSTPGGVSCELTDDSGGRVTVATPSHSVTLETAGITVQSAGKVDITAAGTVSVQAAEVKVQAGQVKLDAALVDCSGVVKCAVLQTNSVISSSYTTGAGNVW
jgi:uncharacterized protein involved in type VI secretion and phage assembly